MLRTATMAADIIQGDRSGIDIYAVRNGLIIGGWYDSMVGIEPLFITWEQVDELRRRSKRRQPYVSAKD
jgi:hypothetical protein